jgi:glucosamine--fructose-6-phosphate aminotransferase (isomerizing)
MKHGPIALIDENMPVVFIAPKDAVYDKVRSNIDEVKARGGCIIGVISEDDTTSWSRSARPRDPHPRTHDMLTPILAQRAAAAAGVPHRRAARAATWTSRGTWRRA